MAKTCLKCGYERMSYESAPEYECPKCGAIYAKVEAIIRAKEDGIKSSYEKKRVLSTSRGSASEQVITEDDVLDQEEDTENVLGEYVHWSIIIGLTVGLLVPLLSLGKGATWAPSIGNTVRAIFVTYACLAASYLYFSVAGNLRSMIGHALYTAGASLALGLPAIAVVSLAREFPIKRKFVALTASMFIALIGAISIAKHQYSGTEQFVKQNIDSSSSSSIESIAPKVVAGRYYERRVDSRTGDIETIELYLWENGKFALSSSVRVPNASGGSNDKGMSFSSDFRGTFRVRGDTIEMRLTSKRSGSSSPLADYSSSTIIGTRWIDGEVQLTEWNLKREKGPGSINNP